MANLAHSVLIVLIVGFPISILHDSSNAADVTPSERVARYLNVREEPKSDSQAVGVLRKGDRAELMDVVPSWYLIRLGNDREGYVPKAWTRLIGPRPEHVSFEIHFVDVGVGDSAIIDMGAREVLIDGGLYKNRLIEYVTNTGLIENPIELVIVTHADSDHWKGMNRLFGFGGSEELYQAKEFWEPGYDRECRPLNSYTTFRTEMKEMIEKQSGDFKRPLEEAHIPLTKWAKAESSVGENETKAVYPRITLPSLPGISFTLLHSEKIY